eukprot:TRINITY_DN19708_c0_g1_i1.p1 TRINITY_DN19708_c0_g1~~TRINITY_DN19708_c0_g1_i1.p1  ORF type:complete len:515 (+),score=67.78 TRINITY_DN19708_c0_g1_i1:43-1545(+)
MSSILSFGAKEGSMWTAYVLTINVVFGSGVLAMPHAIQKAGFLLGEVMLAAISCVAWVTVMWTIEAISRLSYLHSLWSHGEVVASKEDEEGPLMSTQEFDPEIVLFLEANNVADSAKPSTEHIKRWEVNQLCQAFLGTRWAMAYDACLTIYTWAVMWLYVTVWCQAFVTMVPLGNMTSFQECSTPFKGDCENSYRIFVGVFTVTMSVLCIKEWKAFEKIQSFFTIFAYVCLVVMLTSIIVGLMKVPYIDSDGVLATNSSSAPYWADGNKVADFSQFGSLFGTCIFSQMAHQGTAQILDSIDDKKKIGRLFILAFITTSLFYTILSVAAALYFGSLVNDIVTLNWETYSLNSDHSRNAFDKLLFCCIVVFPVGTTSAAYMFFVRTIGQQLQHWVPPHYTETYSQNKVTIVCKVIAFTPPIIGGVLNGNVKTIVNVAGLFGFFVMIVFPSLLQIGSVRLCKKLGVESRTPFEGLHSSINAVYALLVVGAGGLVLYVYNIITG